MKRELSAPSPRPTVGRGKISELELSKVKVPPIAAESSALPTPHPPKLSVSGTGGRNSARGGATGGQDAQGPGDPWVLGPSTLTQPCENSPNGAGRLARLAAHHAPHPAGPGRLGEGERGAPDPTLRVPTSAPAAGQRRRKDKWPQSNRKPKPTRFKSKSSRQFARPSGEPHAQLVKGELRVWPGAGGWRATSHAGLQTRFQTRVQERAARVHP